MSPGGQGPKRPLLLFNGLARYRTGPSHFSIFWSNHPFDVARVGAPPPRVPYRPLALGATARLDYLDQLGYYCVDVLGVSWG